MHESAADNASVAVPGWPVAAAIAAAAALHLAALALHVPLYESFFPYGSKPAGDAVSLGLLAAAAAGLLVLLRSRLEGWRYLLPLMLLSLTLQHGFALTEGRGLEALRSHSVSSGHAEFAELAVKMPDSLAMVQDYEDLVRRHAVGQFAPSKPPGTLLLYMLTERVSAWFAGPDRLAALHWAITYAWPVLATLAVLPLYALARLLFGMQEARLAAALLVTAPSFNLVQMHTDQAFFPALFTGSLLLLAWTAKVQAAGGRIDAPALAAGAGLYAAAFFQLPMAFAAVVAAGMVAMERWSRGGMPLARASLLEYAGMVLAGFALAGVLVWLTVGYNPIIRYLVAMDYHGSLKAAHVPFMLPVGFANLAEFLTWAGMPLSGLAGYAAWLAWTRWREDHVGPDRLLGLAAGLALTLVYFAFFAKTISEVARIWLFLVPLLCLLAARGMTLLDWRARHWVVAAMLLLQLVTVYLTKVNQDFY